MRSTLLATVVSSLLLGAAVQAGDYKMTKEQFTAADKDRDGALTLAEAQAGAPKLAEKFASTNAAPMARAATSRWNPTRRKRLPPTNDLNC